MAFRLYLVPVVGSGVTIQDARRPKYFHLPGGIIAPGQSWSAMDYGVEPWMIVGADLSGGDHALVVANADAFTVPATLDATLTAGQVTGVQTVFEAANIPTGWVTTALTWREVVRTVLGMFAFFQRLGSVYAAGTGQPLPPVFGRGVSLATTFSALPLALRTAMLSTATDLGVSSAGLTAGSSLRAMLKHLADQLQSRPYRFFGQDM